MGWSGLLDNVWVHTMLTAITEKKVFAALVDDLVIG